MNSSSSSEHSATDLSEQSSMEDTKQNYSRRSSLLAPPSAETINRYKDLVKSRSLYLSVDFNLDESGRNDDFYGDSPQISSLKCPLSASSSSSSKKRDDSLRNKFQGQDRPEMWLGSPTNSGRKSYTIKTKSTAIDKASTASTDSHIEVDRRAVLSNQDYKMTASSARLAMPDASDPSVQRFKDMMRARAFSSSHDFYGTTTTDTEVLPVTSPTIITKKAVAHKWGAPDPDNDMQARPTDFLGSPSTKRKSYVIKGEVAPMSPAITTTTTSTQEATTKALPTDLTSSLLHDESKPHKWGAPDPEDEMQARPTDFLGSPVHNRKSYSYTINNIPAAADEKEASTTTTNHHKWGAPDPENDMQARPTDFLGSPSTTKRKSYVIKGDVICSPKSVTATPKALPLLPKSPVVVSPRTTGGKRVSALLERFESNRQLSVE